MTGLGLGSVIDGFIGYHGIIGRNPANNECKRCVPEKEYCTQKANVCVSGKTRYRKWFEKRITTAKRKWNASNDEKLQKAVKTVLRSAKGPQTAEKAESEKRGLFHSPIFHITCIIRNICNQKIRPPFSSGFEFSGLKILMAVWCWVQNVIASSPLVMLCWYF